MNTKFRRIDSFHLFTLQHSVLVKPEIKILSLLHSITEGFPDILLS